MSKLLSLWHIGLQYIILYSFGQLIHKINCKIFQITLCLTLGTFEEAYGTFTKFSLPKGNFLGLFVDQSGYFYELFQKFSACYHFLFASRPFFSNGTELFLILLFQYKSKTGITCYKKDEYTLQNNYYVNNSSQLLNYWVCGISSKVGLL